MKKLICILLSLFICIGLCGCDILVNTSETNTNIDTEATESLIETEIETEIETKTETEPETESKTERKTYNETETCSDMIYYDKPIIYFYPEYPTVCSAKVELNGKLTCTYPEHGNEGWQNFTAYPDGTLIFPDGKEYYALYWEGIQNTKFDFSCGFCVRGEDTVEFLEWALAAQGLTRREANEFIMYWLPRMQENKYNVISFQTSAYTDTAALNITPVPDSILRVFMAYYPSSVEVDIEPQAFEPFIRDGFTVVEWGGTEIGEP